MPSHGKKTPIGQEQWSHPMRGLPSDLRGGTSSDEKSTPLEQEEWPHPNGMGAVLQNPSGPTRDTARALGRRGAFGAGAPGATCAAGGELGAACIAGGGASEESTGAVAGEGASITATGTVTGAAGMASGIRFATPGRSSTAAAGAAAATCGRAQPATAAAAHEHRDGHHAAEHRERERVPGQPGPQRRPPRRRTGHGRRSARGRGRRRGRQQGERGDGRRARSPRRKAHRGQRRTHVERRARAVKQPGVLQTTRTELATARGVRSQSDREALRVGEAPRRLLLHASTHHRLEAERKIGPDLAQRHGRLERGGLGGRGRIERSSFRTEKLPEKDAERPDLRGPVLHSVAVLAGLDRKVDRGRHRHPPGLRRELLEVEAVHVSHHEKRRPIRQPIDVQDARDGVARRARGDAPVPEEARDGLPRRPGAQQQQGDGVVQMNARRAKHPRHRATPEDLVDTIRVGDHVAAPVRRSRGKGRAHQRPDFQARPAIGSELGHGAPGKPGKPLHCTWHTASTAQVRLGRAVSASPMRRIRRGGDDPTRASPSQGRALRRQRRGLGRTGDALDRAGALARRLVWRIARSLPACFTTVRKHEIDGRRYGTTVACFRRSQGITALPARRKREWKRREAGSIHGDFARGDPWRAARAVG